MSHHTTLESLSVGTAAELLSCSTDTIRDLITSGDLPAYKLGQRRPGSLRDTRRLYIRAADLEALMTPVRTMGGTQ